MIKKVYLFFCLNMENLGIIILACHHKSGTLYNKKVFKKLANYLKIKFNLY